MESNLPQQNISIEQLPIIIGDTFKHISEVDRKISNAVSRADEAKKLADEASQKNAGWSLFGSDKKEAIEALQSAAISQANALSDSVDANKELFNNQKKMSEALRYLFGLGVANMAANRTVVRELELKLKNASQEELSELARQEITNVILQLRAQEDMQYKLENHDRILREHKGEIDKILGEINSFEERCKEVLGRTEMLQNDVESKEKELTNKFIEEKRHIQEELKLLSKKLHDDISILSDQLSASIDNKVTSALQVTEPRILSLEQYRQHEIDRRTFFDTKFYKAMVGIISVSALIISCLSLFFPHLQT